MKGIISILELLITGVILVLAFVHFFPQYSIRTNWNLVLLDLRVRDTLTTIDRLNKTYDFSIAAGTGNQFETFMEKVYSPEYFKQTLVWWKEIHGSSYDQFRNSSIPYFTQAQKETIVDTIVIEDTFHVYSFTLGLGYPY